MRKLFFGFILSQCFLLSGFYFQRGNQNVEYDNPSLYPQVLLTFLGFNTRPKIRQSQSIF